MELKNAKFCQILLPEWLSSTSKHLWFEGLHSKMKHGTNWGTEQGFMQSKKIPLECEIVDSLIILQ